MLAYELPPDLKARLEALEEIKTKSRLTAAQREELGDFRFVDDVMTRLKAKISLRLAQENSENCGESSSENDGEASTADTDEKEENGS